MTKLSFLRDSTPKRTFRHPNNIAISLAGCPSEQNNTASKPSISSNGENYPRKCVVYILFFPQVPVEISISALSLSVWDQTDERK